MADHISNQKLADFLTDDILSLIILPTEQCNFRCVYCYEDFSIGKMKSNTVESIKKLILNRVVASNPLKSLNISWFGGEPLVAKDVMIDICTFVADLRLKYPYLKFSSGVTTNASLLTLPILSKLVNLGIHTYQISLDGPKEFHDKTRLQIGGRPSFDLIWSNLVAAKTLDKNFNFRLRLHVTSENHTYMSDLVKKIKDVFGNDSRYSVYFREIGNYGGPNVGKFDVLQGKAKDDILSNLRKMWSGELLHNEPTGKNVDVCYAGKANSFVIRADGALAKCTVALSDPKNYIGYLDDMGKLIINNPLHAAWLRGLKTLNTDTLNCPLKNFPKSISNTSLVKPFPIKISTS